MHYLIKVIATTPAAILIAFGSIGYLLQMEGSSTLLTVGVLLQVAWLVLRR